MNAPLDEQYFTWLYSQVGSVRLRNRNRTHWSLLKQLYETEFVWFVPNDDNRVEDGRDLRLEFLDSEGIDKASSDWLHMGCSMLEMLIGLSRRLAFEDDGEPRSWFWHLIDTLELTEYNDNNYDYLVAQHVEETLHRVIYRRYRADGVGGLFPLRHAEEDQRNVELWYQMSAYLLELFYP